MSEKIRNPLAHPPPLSEKNQKFANPPSPPCKKIRNWLTPPPPTVADIICERPLTEYELKTTNKTCQEFENTSKSLEEITHKSNTLQEEIPRF